MKTARGFSLVEVLVALIIIAVGMLGLAKLQALAYASTGTASLRSLAAIEASSMASAMRINRNYWSSIPVTTNLTINFTGTTITVVGDATLVANTSCLAVGGSNAPCTANQLAAADLQTWVADLNLVLPAPTGNITCPIVVGISPVSCTIQINWTERTVAANTNSVGATPMSAPIYTLYVEP